MTTYVRSYISVHVCKKQTNSKAMKNQIRFIFWVLYINTNNIQ